mmetsp:Transcript_11181/g.37276  ORF Transcript_11181/g.37276 Transcript_11181/m.37276 type:complete len:220 (+) Transcript_11181:467-1126(+)
MFPPRVRAVVERGRAALGVRAALLVQRKGGRRVRRPVAVRRAVRRSAVAVRRVRLRPVLERGVVLRRRAVVGRRRRVVVALRLRRVARVARLRVAAVGVGVRDVAVGVWVGELGGGGGSGDESEGGLFRDDGQLLHEKKRQRRIQASRRPAKLNHVVKQLLLRVQRREAALVGPGVARQRQQRDAASDVVKRDGNHQSGDQRVARQVGNHQIQLQLFVP